MRYERARRLPVRVSRVGTGAPAVGERAVVAEYAGPAGARLLVVAGTDRDARVERRRPRARASTTCSLARESRFVIFGREP